MMIQEGKSVTRYVETKITNAVDLTLNAVKLVMKGTKAKYIKEAAVDTPAINVEGAIFAIGPPQISQTDANVDEPVTVQKGKIFNLILKQGEVVEDQEPLSCAGDGKVQVAAHSATMTSDERAMVVAIAQEDVNATSADKAVEAYVLDNPL